MQSFALILTLAQIMPYSFAAAIDRIDRDLYQASDLTLFAREDAPTCGGVEGLSTCGADFPSSFCCPASTVCTLLNANATTAAICCPEDSDCVFIKTITCDKSALDPIKNPTSPVHASPVIDMPTCGSECCPPGYECDTVTERCNRIAADAGQSTTATTVSSTTSTVESTSSSVPVTSTLSSTDSGITLVPTASSTADADTSHASSLGPHDEKEHFNGKSFAAGFVPGIFLGLLAATAIIWIIVRRRRRGDSYVDNEKRDTLTPTSRSNSDPIAEDSYAHRTEFSYGQSPPLRPHINLSENTQKPLNPSPYTPQPQAKIKPAFGFSPMTTPKPTQSPLPQHFNRGTINWPKGIPTMIPGKSYHISPIRGLNRKKSVNSLRRHARTASAASDASTRRLTNTTMLTRKDSEASTGTIKLSFPEAEMYASPDMRGTPPQGLSRSNNPQHGEPETLGTQTFASPPTRDFTPAGASTRSLEDRPSHERTFTTAMIPPPIPLHVANPDFSTSSSSGSSNSSGASNMRDGRPQLGSPYTPTRKQSSNTVGKATRMLGGVGGGLTVQREPAGRPLPATLGVPVSDAEHDVRRDTTFSGMMRTAGLTDSYLYGGRN